MLVVALSPVNHRGLHQGYNNNSNNNNSNNDNDNSCHLQSRQVMVASPSLARNLGEYSTIPLLSLGQNQSTVAQRAETTVAECSLATCM